MTGSCQTQITVGQDTIRGVYGGFPTTMIIQSGLKFSVYLMGLVFNVFFPLPKSHSTLVAGVCCN